MKIRLAVMIGLIAVLLCACSYHLVEDNPLQVGNPVIRQTISKE